MTATEFSRPDTSMATIRVATPADTVSVRRVIGAAYAEYGDVVSPDLYEAYLADLLDFDARRDGSVLLVAEVDGDVAGTVTFYPDAATAGFGWPAGWAAIRALAVDPSARGRGLARRLVDAGIDRATAAGVPVIGLHTAEIMTAAVRLYEERGFTRAPSFDVVTDQIVGVGDADAPPVIAYRLDLAADTYVLGRSDAETRRLVLQHQLYAPITRQLFTSAGITRGMRVLDLGSGAGDVALLLADIVGPGGQVVGIDMNPDILVTARARAEAAGWTNVEFHHGNIHHLEVGHDFDAVVGRWILMYLPDPAAALRALQTHLRPGGIVAFLESADLIAAVRAFPTTPTHETITRWTTPLDDVAGPTTDMGLQLYRTFIAAGLPNPQLRVDAPIGGGPDWPGYTLVAESIRSMLPFLEHVGVVTAAEADVDTLAGRLRDEVMTIDGVQILPTVIGAWSHRRWAGPNGAHGDALAIISP